MCAQHGRTLGGASPFTRITCMYVSNAKRTNPGFDVEVQKDGHCIDLSLDEILETISFKGYINHFQSRFGVLADEKLNEVKKLIECGEMLCFPRKRISVNSVALAYSRVAMFYSFRNMLYWREAF